MSSRIVGGASQQGANASRQGSSSSLKGSALRRGESQDQDDDESSSGENATVLKRVDIARKGGKLDLTNLELSEVPSVATDLGEFVRVVWLYENTLKQLPPEISQWTNLTQLRVSKNRLLELPQEIGQFKSLAMLFVDENRLSALPTTIGNCRNLRYLNFKANKIRRLPVQLGLINVLNDIVFEGNPLEFPHKAALNLGKNFVLKYIRRFVKAKETGLLDLTKAGLAEIPAEIAYCGKDIKALVADDILPNAGLKLPFELGACSNLKTASFHPQLRMLSPEEAVVEQGIEVVVAYLARFNDAMGNGNLDLSHMHMSSFPQELSDEKNMKPERVSTLDISDNRVSLLPQALAQLVNLTELNAEKNMIKSIPASMGRLNDLRRLDLSNNGLLEMAEAFGRNQKLETFLARKNLVNSISPDIGPLPVLRHLDLGQNTIKSMPSGMCEWRELRTLLLDVNAISELPNRIYDLSQLEVLDLSTNKVKYLVESIGQLRSLEDLLLSENPLVELPEQIGQLSRLTRLELLGCPKLVSLPLTLGDISRFCCPLVFGEPYLRVLKVDGSLLKSPPPEIVALGLEAIVEHLNILRTAHTSRTFVYPGMGLVGFPHGLLQITNLTSLKLMGNKLTDLGKEITRLAQLTELDLDGNQLVDLPETIAKLSELSSISLRDNPLQRLPAMHIGSLRSLQTLILDDPGPELIVPAKEVSRKGGQAVLEYSRRIALGWTEGRLEGARLGLKCLPIEVVEMKGAIWKLSLAHNQVQVLDDTIAECSGLSVLRLHDNKLEALPMALQVLSGLTELDLDGNRIAACPDVLSTLTGLTMLNMRRNAVQDCPVHVCAMTRLTELRLDHNSISVLPNRLGRCVQLILLSVSHNLLTRLPTVMKDLTSLTLLNVACNSLTIIPPEVGLLPALECVDCQGNELESPPLQIVDSGTVAMSQYLEKIRSMMETGQVDLDNCGLEQVPLDVVSYDAVHTIILTRNKLVTIAPAIGNLRHLKSLDLSYNALICLPEELGRCIALEELMLSRNELTTIPWNLGSCTNLRMLTMDHELVTDPPPTVSRRGGPECVRYLRALMAASSTGKADLAGFDLDSIPPQVLAMPSIEELDLRDNKLDKLPPAIVMFTQLVKLTLDGNKELRDLPKTMRAMSTLQDFSIGDNENKTMPEEIFRLTSLTRLRFADNLLEGIGGQIGQLEKLTHLDLSHNRLWTLPWAAILKMQLLKKLELQGNPITVISPSIAELSQLTVIDLSSTSLPMLPADIIDLPELSTLLLDDVDIQGPSVTMVQLGLEAIKSFLQLIRQARSSTELELEEFQCDGGRNMGISPYKLETVLQKLSVRNSQLDFVPAAVLALTSLTHLDLSKNKLNILPEPSGTAWPFLEVLIVTDNVLQTLPSSFGGLTALTELVLTTNMLETLPASIAQCTGLTRMNLVNNQVTYLPREAKSLTKLRQLEMDFKFLTDLQTLDLNWSLWGEPPADIILQGGKTVIKFYQELLGTAGQAGGLGLQSSTLRLRKFGLLQVPQQITLHYLSHISTLDLSYNPLESVDPNVSSLHKLKHLKLKGCPVRYLPTSLGSLDGLSVEADVRKLQNVPEVWRKKGEAGVMVYLQKAFLEISVHVLDLSGMGLRGLQADLIDLVPVTELYLDGNSLTRLPPSVSILTNLKVLKAQNNRLCCLPRQFSAVTKLTTMSLEGNSIAILPTDLGRLTNLTELGFDNTTLPSIPVEVVQQGTARIMEFLLKIDKSKGQRRMVTPFPGLSNGDWFHITFDGVEYELKVPLTTDMEHRERFPAYLPPVSQAERRKMERGGIEFMDNTNIGHVLDLENLGLTEFRLVAVPGLLLDKAQSDFLEVYGELDEKALRVLTGESKDLEDDEGYDAEESEVQAVQSLSASNHSALLRERQIELEKRGGYQVDNEGVLLQLEGEENHGIAAKALGFVGGMLGLTDKKATISARDLPVMPWETEDMIAVWMMDRSLMNAWPLPVCVTTHMTELRLDGNDLQTLPSSIGTLSSLTCLSCRDNRLQAVSWRLRYLVQLRELHLSNNLLEELPPKLGRCNHLQVLSLDRNQLRQLPVSIGRLSALTTLDLSDNPLMLLPHEVGGVDKEEFKEVAGLISLQRMSLVDCVHLRHLPSKIFRLTTLQQLDLVGANGLITPPREILEQGMVAVMAFMERLYQGEQTLNLSLAGLGLTEAPHVLVEMDRRLNEKQMREVGMQQLRQLDLGHNHLIRIASRVSKLTNLRALILDYNHLQDELPAWLSVLTRLALLSVSHNELTSLGRSIGALVSVRRITANHNRLEFMVDEMKDLTTMEELSLEGNGLRIIPECLMQLSNLQTLRLASNLIDRIPPSLNRMTSLQRMMLNGNRISEVPETVGEMQGLVELDLADNSIEMLPVGFGKLSALTKLEVRRNGCIRPPKGTQAQGPMAVVEYLRRIENALERKLLDIESFGLTSFPVDALALQELTELNVSGNTITTFPPEISGLSRLLVLRIGRINLQTLPAVVCKLETVRTLDVHGNRLEALPTSLAGMTALVHLVLANNKLEIFPPVLEQLTQMEHLDLTDNSLSRLPYMIGRYHNATAILLGGNKLVVMPGSIGELGPVVLAVLNLSDNGLQRVPPALCNVRTLRTVCLSGNALDEIPSQFGKLADLRELWVDNNRIVQLPPTLGGWHSLRQLFAHNNALLSLPKSVVELVTLETLTLSGNKLQSLPWNLAALSNLRELWLDGNELNSLPKGLEDLQFLQTLSCKHNHFQGLDLERAEELQDRFKDEAVEQAMREQTPALASDEKDSEVVEVEALPSDGDDVLEEIRLLEEEKQAAYDAGDFDNVEHCQTLIDSLQDRFTKITRGGESVSEKREDPATQKVVFMVHVIGCEGLSALDKRKKKLCDAYVTVSAGKEKFKTKVVKKDLNPQFQEPAFSFKPMPRNECHPTLSVYHSNTFSADFLLGETVIDTNIPLSSHVGDPITLPLTLETPFMGGETGGPGEVILRMGLSSAT